MNATFLKTVKMSLMKNNLFGKRTNRLKLRRTISDIIQNGNNTLKK